AIDHGAPDLDHRGHRLLPALHAHRGACVCPHRVPGGARAGHHLAADLHRLLALLPLAGEAMGPLAAATGPVATLIYDGECAMCRASALWIMRRALDAGTLEILPCRSAPRRARFPQVTDEQCLTAMQLVLPDRSEEHTSELQSLRHLVCRLLLEKKNDRRLRF